MRDYDNIVLVESNVMFIMLKSFNMYVSDIR